MATYNVEVRQRVSGAFGDIIYPKANWNNMDNKPSTFPPTSHSHGNITNAGAIGTTANLVVQTGTDGALTAKAAGTTSQFLRGDGAWATPTLSLSTGYGDTTNPYASKTAKYFLAAPNAANGAPTFRAILASDIPTLNQSTTGNAATATKLATARNFTIGPTAKSFDGSAVATWTLAEIGINVVTTCPTAAATSGRVNIYTGTSCATKYANWLYFET